MKLFFTAFLFLFVGCVVNSIAPSSGGLEVDFDFSRKEIRHGWTYLSKPFVTKTQEYDETSIRRGKGLYMQHCEKCHGIKGVGDGELAKALKINPANLTKLPNDMDKAYLLVQIQDGKGSMPQWRDLLTDSQVVDLTNFIKGLSSK